MTETLAEVWIEDTPKDAFSINHQLEQHNWQIRLEKI